MNHHFFCDCHADSCRHITFALNVPAVEEVVEKKRKEGWKLPENA